MMSIRELLFLNFLFMTSTFAIYGRVPGEPYIDFMRNLNSKMRVEVREIIFNPELTKAEAKLAVQKYAHDKYPLLMQAFDRALLDYEDLEQENELLLDQRAKNFSMAGKKVDRLIRGIYKNESLTERQACEAAADVIANTRWRVLKEVGLEPMDCDRIFNYVLAKFNKLITSECLQRFSKTKKRPEIVLQCSVLNFSPQTMRSAATRVLVGISMILLTVWSHPTSVDFDYWREPGQRYLSFIKHLGREQRRMAQNIIFNPQKSRREAYRDLQKWANRISPLTMMSLDRSQLDYESMVLLRNERFDRRASKLTAEARELDESIRSVLDDDSISELTCCEMCNALIAKSSEDVRNELDVEVIRCDKNI
ncbi:hypothetical protein M3Y96_00577200 [Aphelenchoides besseyi]|nr:hypothetical protein M3Y96_00577200 [Aphelenchoides besseyi]